MKPPHTLLGIYWSATTAIWSETASVFLWLELDSRSVIRIYSFWLWKYISTVFDQNIFITCWQRSLEAWQQLFDQRLHQFLMIPLCLTQLMIGIMYMLIIRIYIYNMLAEMHWSVTTVIWSRLHQQLSDALRALNHWIFTVAPSATIAKPSTVHCWSFDLLIFWFFDLLIFWSFEYVVALIQWVILCLFRPVYMWDMLHSSSTKWFVCGIVTFIFGVSECRYPLSSGSCCYEERERRQMLSRNHLLSMLTRGHWTVSPSSSSSSSSLSLPTSFKGKILARKNYNMHYVEVCRCAIYNTI